MIINFLDTKFIFFTTKVMNNASERKGIVLKLVFIDDSLLNCYWKVDTEDNELFSSANVVRDGNDNILSNTLLIVSSSVILYLIISSINSRDAIS